MRTAAIAIATALLALASTAGAANDSAITLAWIAPAECPSVAEVRSDLERMLGRSLDRGVNPAMEVRARAESTNGGWRLTISVTSSEGAPHERTVEGASCDELADAAEVIVAFAAGADPSATPKRARHDRPMPTLVPNPPPIASDAPLPPPPKPGLRFGLVARGGVDLASLPAPTPGFDVGLSFAFGPLAIEPGFSMWLARRAFADASSDAGGDVSLVTGDVRLCWRFLDRPLVIRGCGGVEVGALSASGFGVRAPSSGSSPWVAPLAALGAGFPLGARVRTTLDVEALAPLVRDEFTLGGVGDVYRPPAITGRALFGLSVDLF